MGLSNILSQYLGEESSFQGLRNSVGAIQILGGGDVIPYSRCFVRKGMPLRYHQLTLLHQGGPEALSLNQILCNKQGGNYNWFPP